MQIIAPYIKLIVIYNSTAHISACLWFSYKLKICMDKNFLPFLFTDFFLKISNFPDFFWSCNKFPDFPGVETLPLLAKIPSSKTKTHQGVIQKKFFGSGSTKKCDHVCDQLGICIECTYISESILLLHQGKFVKVKWVKVPRLAPLQVSKYIKSEVMCMSL